MIYLSEFTFPGEDKEWNYMMSIKRQCYSTYYPFSVFTKNHLNSLSFEPITILYGSNGSGKSTALNVIANINEGIDLDADSVDIKKWYELKNIRSYYNFFKAHESELSKG